jgi:uncharacterized protein YrzB (UPF0473 family)
MSDKIADAIRLLVEDGAEITYSRTSNFEVPEFLKETYRLQERERITDLLQNELGAGVDTDDTDTRDAIIKRLINLIGGKND